MKIMKRRLMGIETEFGLTSSIEDYTDGTLIAQLLPEFLIKNPLTIRDFDDLFLKQCKNRGEFNDDVLNCVGQFMSNGDRIYYSSQHLEISTRDCRSIFDVAAADQADTRIFEALIRKFQKQNPVYGLLRGFKNTVSLCGGQQISWGGRHENYQMERSAWDGMSHLIPFFLTRQILTASGNVRTTAINSYWKGFDSYFELSPRSNFIKSLWGPDTTSARTLINTRDDNPFVHPMYRRFHFIAGDPANCSYTTALAFGMTHLVLRLIEEVKNFKSPVIEDPLGDANEHQGAMRQVSAHPYLPIKLKDEDKSMTPAKIQRFYLESVEREFAGTDSETDWILKNWKARLDDFESSRNAILLDTVGLVEWFTRFDLIMKRVELVKRVLTNDEYQTHFGDGARSDHIDLSNERDLEFIMNQNLEYDDVDMARGLPYSIPMKVLCFPNSPEYVLSKIFDPAFDTLSSIRAFPIQFYPDKVAYVDWNKIGLKDGRTLNLEQTLSVDADETANLFMGKVSFDRFLKYCNERGILKQNS